MKKIVSGLFIASTLITGCSKNKHTGTSATILSARYACGPACSASTFVVKPSGDSSVYLPANLPPAYKVHNLPVIVDFTKTGEFPEQYKGPGVEVIRINNIYQ